MTQPELRKLMEEINPHVRSVAALLIFLADKPNLDGRAPAGLLAEKVGLAYSAADRFMEMWYQNALGDE